jgi:two-component system, cell cycle sensor histidine kinase and response regulator CckA
MSDAPPSEKWQEEITALRRRVAELEHAVLPTVPYASLLAAGLEHLADAVELTDAAGRIVWVNRAFERLTGYSEEEARGHTPAELLRSDVHDPAYLESAWEGLLSGRPFVDQLTSRKKDGSFFTNLLNATPIADGTGRVCNVLVIRRDVTEERRAEKALRESQELYRQIFQNNRAIKLLIDPATGAIEDANSAAAVFYGYPAEILRRMKITDINALPPDEVAEEMVQAEAERRTYFRFPHRLSSGELRRVEVFSGPVYYGGKKLLFSIIHDVTDRERAEEELVRSETRFRSVIEQIPLGIAVHRGGKFVYVNRALQTMLGYDDPAELLALDGIEIMHPADRQQVTSRVAAIFSRGAPAPRTEERLLRKDGSVVVADVAAIPVLFDGAPAALAIIQDVTERLKLEEQLRRSQRMEAVGRLAGGVAHDFNNLLFVILNSAHFLKRRLPDGDTLGGDVDQIHAAARRAADLTKQLLLFSRGADAKSDVVDVNAVVADVARLLRGTLGEQVELRTVQSAVPAQVTISKSNLEQVLVNLAVNARDAMPEGGLLTVETSVVELDAPSARKMLGLEPGKYVRILVTDTGVGMTPEVARHAFEPFFTTKTQGTGTGLGLAITYGIVQKAAGHIALETTEGAGTRFCIHLPLTEAKGASDVESVPPSNDTSGRGETILLVEDETAVRAVVERVLSEAGYEVLVAPGPGEALLVAEQHRAIHLLLTDVIMPRMSGTDLAERLRKLRPGLPVVFMSGYAGDALTSRGVNEEKVDLLHKPFTEAELLERIRKVLSRLRSSARVRADDLAACEHVIMHRFDDVVACRHRAESERDVEGEHLEVIVVHAVPGRRRGAHVPLRSHRVPSLVHAHGEGAGRFGDALGHLGHVR